MIGHFLAKHNLYIIFSAPSVQKTFPRHWHHITPNRTRRISNRNS